MRCHGCGHRFTVQTPDAPGEVRAVKCPNCNQAVRVVGPPVRFGQTPGAIRTGPPAVGQHTNEVLKALGYSDGELRAFRQEGVV